MNHCTSGCPYPADTVHRGPVPHTNRQTVAGLVTKRTGAFPTPDSAGEACATAHFSHETVSTLTSRVLTSS
jgi:hypothetical protein